MIPNETHDKSDDPIETAPKPTLLPDDLLDIPRPETDGPLVVVPYDMVIPPTEPIRVDHVSYQLSDNHVLALLVVSSITDNPVLFDKLGALVHEKYSAYITCENRDFRETPTRAIVHGEFELRPDGVYKISARHVDPRERADHVESTDPEDESLAEERVQLSTLVCSWLEVTAVSCNDKNDEWGKVLTWRDRHNQKHTWCMSDAFLGPGYSNGLSEQLLRGGLKIESHKLLKQYLNRVTPAKSVLNVPRVGWHELKSAGQVFVLSKDKVLGAKGTEKDIILQSEFYNPADAPTVAGSLADWQKNVAALCVGNDMLVLAVSVAFAAPTLHLLEEPSGGFHLVGESSLGKTTALAVGASVWGHDHKQGTWKTTSAALENTAESRNDMLLTLDELAFIDAAGATNVAYLLASGGGSNRNNASGTSQHKKTWRLLFLSSGEITLSEHAKTVGKTTRGGTEVRMINLDADLHVVRDGVKLGMFQNIHGTQPCGGLIAPAVFADLLKKTNVEKYHGVAGPEFVKYLIQNESIAVKDMKELMKEFLSSVKIPTGAAGEINRVAKQFAIVAAAGELATKADITGWAPGTAMAAALFCFDRWLNGRSSTGSSDTEKAIAQIRKILMAHTNRFESLDVPSSRFSVSDRLGFSRTVDEGIEYLVSVEAFQNELCENYNSTTVARGLLERGYLRVTGKGRFQVQHKIPGMGTKPLRFYAIQSSILGEDPEE